MELPRIRQLDKFEYTGFKLEFAYSAECYYDTVRKPGEIFDIKLVRRRFETPIEKRFDGYLFEDHLASPTAYCIYSITDMGYLQVDRETWHNRMRITELIILPEYRRMGLGRLLIGKAKALAKEEGFRELVLETQSCNTIAMDFYESCGFAVMGIDLSCYSNDDVSKNEIRVEMAFTIGNGELAGGVNRCTPCVK